MLKYLTILLSDNSLSFCHYDSFGDTGLISLEDLKSAVLFGMKENLMIQFIYPEFDIPDEYERIIDSIDSVKYKPLSTAGCEDIGISDSWPDSCENLKARTIVIRRTIDELLNDADSIVNSARFFDRINIVIKDIPSVKGERESEYRFWINNLAVSIGEIYKENCMPQINILTDRVFLESPNHCGAGIDSITVAPDGKFYICPAFYYSNLPSVGNVGQNPLINNIQLLELKNAPICRICDAWHCRRCVWLNQMLTKEINTPGRQQCVTAHIEREGSVTFLKSLQSAGLASDREIKILDYIDPFDNLEVQ